MRLDGYYQPAAAPARPAAAAPAPVYASSPVDSFLSQMRTFAPLTAGAAPGLRVARRIREVSSLSARARLRAGAPTMRGAFWGGIRTAVVTSLVVKGLTSLALNAYRVYKKQETFADAAANVAGDLISSVVAGTAAGVASGLGTLLLSGILGTGMGLAIAGMAIGTVTFFVADGLLRDAMWFNNVKAAVHEAMG